MEWIKHMSLKKSLFVLMLVSLITAAGLTALTFFVYFKTGRAQAPDGMLFYVNESYVIEPEDFPAKTQSERVVDPAALLQLLLPVFIFLGALLLAVFLFYRWKLKEPLTILRDAATRIMENDLDFTIPASSDDELGRLCAAFEKMRGALVSNNKKLWGQTEEQKRLNAAFSHDLRNPLTVLKGSAKMARRCAPDDEALNSHLMRIEAYTGRMERYVEIMSSVGRLGQMPLERISIRADVLSKALDDAVGLIASENRPPVTDGDHTHPAKAAHGITLDFRGTGSGRTISIDKNALFQIAENLVANALRFAKARVSVSLLLDAQTLTLTVADDGPGFPDKLLENGIRPFQKGTEDAEHFGMGLYICALLCEKHGGHIDISNLRKEPALPGMEHVPIDGAKICASLSVF